MKFRELREAVELLLDDPKRRPVVVYSALWPLMLHVSDIAQRDLPQAVMQMLLDIVGRERTLLMPTFTAGYKNGVCNLDSEPATTGVLCEMLRCLPQSQRSLSAFFSYAIVGPSAEEAAELLPRNAWGDDSVYGWMEEKDASFLMLGTHPTFCSYLHRIEWLARDCITYRYLKAFSGKIIRQGREHQVTEQLFVRNLNPTVINDFTFLYNELRENGLAVAKLDRVHVACASASQFKKTFLPKLLNDPFISVRNRADFECSGSQKFTKT